MRHSDTQYSPEAVSCNAFLHIPFPHTPFSIPPIPPSRELLEGSLIHQVDNGFGCTDLVLDVAHPALELERVAEYLLFVGEIAFLLRTYAAR